MDAVFVDRDTFFISYPLGTLGVNIVLLVMVLASNVTSIIILSYLFKLSFISIIVFSKSLIEYTFIRYTLFLYYNDLDNLNDSLNMKYNPETYYIQILIDGEWINYKYFNPNELITLIPIMTSNTNPSGKASASSEQDDNLAYKAFNGNDFDRWVATGKSPQSLCYMFENPVLVNKISMIFQNSLEAISTFIIQGSNDNNIWDDIYSGTAQKTSDSQEFDFDNSIYYKYYRIYVTGTYNSAYVNISTLQLYGYKS